MSKLSKDTAAYTNKLKYILQYTGEKYERINLLSRKGLKNKYKEYATVNGMSLSEFFLKAADEYIENHK